MGAKDCCNQRLEAATISEILHLFGQGILTFIREKSGKSQGILKTDVCGNNVKPCVLAKEINLLMEAYFSVILLKIIESYKI